MNECRQNYHYMSEDKVNCVCGLYHTASINIAAKPSPPTAAEEYLGPLIEKRFIDEMKRLGEYGCKVHNDTTWKEPRRPERSPVQHLKGHLDAYIHNRPHKHFQDPKYHLISIAYNAMMEFYWREMEDSKKG